MILVVGATGSVGGAVAHALLSQGRPVRVLLRHNSPSAELAKMGMATSAESLLAAGAQPVYGDLKDRPSLDAACRSVDVIVTSANSALRSEPDTAESVDLKGNRNLIEAAKAAGVKQFIFISALGAHVDSPSAFMAAKAHTELTLMASGLNYTIISPMAFMEVWPSMVVGMPASRGLPVTLVGQSDYRISFISAHDVVAFTVAAIGNLNAANRRLEIGGPQALSYPEVVKVYESVLGRPIPVESVQPGQPIPGLPPSMVEILAGTAFDQIIDSSAEARTFGVIPTTLEEVIRSAAPPNT